METHRRRNGTFPRQHAPLAHARETDGCQGPTRLFTRELKRESFLETQNDDSRRGNETMSRVSSNLFILPGRTCTHYSTFSFSLSLFLSDHSTMRFPFLFHAPHLSSVAQFIAIPTVHRHGRVWHAFIPNTLRGKERHATCVHQCTYAHILGSRYETRDTRLQSHVLDSTRDSDRSDVWYSGISRHSTLNTRMGVYFLDRTESCDCDLRHENPGVKDSYASNITYT